MHAKHHRAGPNGCRRKVSESDLCNARAGDWAMMIEPIKAAITLGAVRGTWGAPHSARLAPTIDHRFAIFINAFACRVRHSCGRALDKWGWRLTLPWHGAWIHCSDYPQGYARQDRHCHLCIYSSKSISAAFWYAYIPACTISVVQSGMHKQPFKRQSKGHFAAVPAAPSKAGCGGRAECQPDQLRWQGG